MSDAALRTDESLEARPWMGVRNFSTFHDSPRRLRSTEIIRRQAAPFNDALEGADGDGFVAVHGHDHLPAVGMAPFLMASLLADHDESMAAQDSNDIFGAANWESFAHVSATSSTLAPAGSGSGDGSNHSSKASFALRTASSSMSPAEAHPGSSGKTADQRLASGSCSTTSRSFMAKRIIQRHQSRKHCSTHSPASVGGRVRHSAHRFPAAELLRARSDAPYLTPGSDAPVQTQAGLETQPPMPVRRMNH